MNQLEAGAAPAAPRVPVSGVCYALFVYDIGFAIDLKAADRLMREGEGAGAVRGPARSRKYFTFEPEPLRVYAGMEPVVIGGAAEGFATSPRVECVLYDFGAVAITYAIPFGEGGCDLERLIGLSVALYDNAALLEESRRRAAAILERVRPAVDRPGLTPLVEDYAVYHFRERGGGGEPGREWAEANAGTLARLLRSERGPLSRQEVADATGGVLSYAPTDVAVVDWNAAVLVMDDADEARAAIEFANVELLEMRWLDDRLDRAVEEAYESVQPVRTRLDRLRRYTSFGTRAAEIDRVGRMQVDGALLFESVNNALKVLGDQYLARLYRLAAGRFHLAEWDAGILRKLETVESIYQKLSDRRANLRMELLEWIIIILIAIEVFFTFFPSMRPGGGG